jgi:8-oxo-dGTP pyrophosphatase MutT (NUDIX family)
MSLYLHSSSAGGVVIKDDKVLVITSALRSSTEFPKGTIEPNEPIELTAVREVEEETGYRVKIIDDLGGSTFDFKSGDDGRMYRKTVFYFLMELSDNETPIQNLQVGEDFTSHWLTIDEARDQLTFDDARIILANALKSTRLAQ